jgi:SAM-dependent methyltransferase
MNRIYIPELVYKLDPSFVKELNNLREKYAISIIDKEYNDLTIKTTLDYVKNNRTNNTNILEFGCGNGYAGEYIKKNFSESKLYGIDIRKPLERKLLSFYNDFTVRGINQRFTYSDNYFDLIFSFFVFHFYVSSNQLKEISRVLKPNSLLCFNLINSSDFSILDRLYKIGFRILDEIEINTINNSGKVYVYKSQRKKY